MIKRQKFQMGVLILLLVFIFTACGQNNKPDSDKQGNTVSAEQEEQQNTEPKIKVALLLPGTINDMGWNAAAYEGLTRAEKEYGVEIAYAESVSNSDMEEMFRLYAEQGFKVIFGHGFQFNEAAKIVGQQFPDTYFIITSSDISQAPNVLSVNIDDVQGGFIMGAIGAYLSKNNVVGYVGGMTIPSITNFGLGYEQGAKYVKPDIKVLATYTGSFEDSAKAKEVGLAMIEQKADVLHPNANESTLGVFEACMEKNVTATGNVTDQHEVAPDLIPVSEIKDVPLMFSYIVGEAINGRLEPKFYQLGLAENALHLSPWYNDVNPDIINKIDVIIEELISGKIQPKYE